MRSSAVLSQAFPARISAVEALIEAIQPRTNNAERLRQVANELDRAGPLYGRAKTAATYAAFAELVRTVAMLVQWRAAIFSAESDADRFLRAAQARHRQWHAEYAGTGGAVALQAASSTINRISSIEDVQTICRAISSTPLPIGVFAQEPLAIPTGVSHAESPKEEPPELAVAFMSFLIDSVPADKIHFLEPGVVHDLELEVRVSRWPEAAERLLITPVTIEAASTYEFPQFEWPRPLGEPPFRVRQRGRAMLKAAQGLTARPFEFKYAAAFKPDTAEQPIAVVGQRTLLIEGIDLEQSPLTGYHAVDRKLIDIRNKLRALPLMTPSDLDSTLKVVIALAGLAARAVNDRLFKDTASEPQFQVAIRNDLRRTPSIAADLEEHPHAAGGITDLSFRGIPIELKFEDQVAVSLPDCERYIGQTLSYTVARNKRVATLCVLDNSPKNSHPFPAEEGIGILTHSTRDSDIHVVTVIIQGNLPRPSDLSR